MDEMHWMCQRMGKMLLRIILHLRWIPPTSIHKGPALCKEPHRVLHRMQSKGRCHLQSGRKRDMEALRTGWTKWAWPAKQDETMEAGRLWEVSWCVGRGDESANSVTDTWHIYHYSVMLRTPYKVAIITSVLVNKSGNPGLEGLTVQGHTIRKLQCHCCPKSSTHLHGGFAPSTMRHMLQRLQLCVCAPCPGLHLSNTINEIMDFEHSLPIS